MGVFTTGLTKTKKPAALKDKAVMIHQKVLDLTIVTTKTANRLPTIPDDIRKIQKSELNMPLLESFAHSER